MPFEGVWGEVVLIAAFLLFIVSCTSQKVTSQTDTLPQAIPAGNRQPAVDTLREKEYKKHKEDDLPVIDTFDIALILPFYLDSVREIPDTVEVSYYQQSELAIEFYNGVSMALDSLGKKGLHARIHVYDDANDKERIKRIAQLPEFRRMDLLLGPIYNANLRIMSEFAKRDSILLVSPLSPAMKITRDNPFYVMVNPGIEVHCKKIFDYVLQHHSKDNLLLFTQPDSVRTNYGSVFLDYLRKYQSETGLYEPQFRIVNYVRDDSNESPDVIDEDLAAYFDETRRNIVLVPSVDKAYIHSIGRSLYPLIEPPRELDDAAEHDITVFGLPVWGDQEGLRLDYAQKMRVHFTSSYYIDTGFYNTRNPLYKNYLEKFQNEPSEYVMKGFDLMLFFGELMLKYGMGFDSMLCVEKARGIHTYFHFGYYPAPNEASASMDTLFPAPRTDFIENKYVHLLKYEEYSVKKVE
ncbi:MAG TPA: ABC transporter substrate-binding protein [Chitinophagales bacterium]|nr:ABC transporter substrate-binding protein [Chitinophagales bacterium]